jgi:hypothetical protein
MLDFGARVRRYEQNEARLCSRDTQRKSENRAEMNICWRSLTPEVQRRTSRIVYDFEGGLNNNQKRRAHSLHFRASH